MDKRINLFDWEAEAFVNGSKTILFRPESYNTFKLQMQLGIQFINLSAVRDGKKLIILNDGKELSPLQARKIALPLGASGDTLHCREAWWTRDEYLPPICPYEDLDDFPVWYKADGAANNPKNPYKWYSPSKMPDCAIRRHFKVVDAKIVDCDNLYMDDWAAMGVPMTEEDWHILMRSQGCTDNRPDFIIKKRFEEMYGYPLFSYLWIATLESTQCSIE